MANMWIRGEEFCPQLFQKRSFHYWRLPGTKLRIGSTTLSPAVSPCNKSILQTLASSGVSEWHVSKVGYGSVARDLSPQILIDYLDAKDANGAKVWDAWSFRNSQQAAVLWPIVQQVALQEMYHCVPDLLRTSNSDLDFKTLDKNLRMVCLQAAQSKLKALQEAKNADGEKELRRWILELTDDYQEYLEFAKGREAFAEN